MRLGHWIEFVSTPYHPFLIRGGDIKGYNALSPGPKGFPLYPIPPPPNKKGGGGMGLEGEPALVLSQKKQIGPTPLPLNTHLRPSPLYIPPLLIRGG